MSARREEIEFVGGAGARLAGELWHPDGPARRSVLVTHCFTCSKDLHTTTRLARALRDAGFVVLTFDFTGLGGSGGDFAATTVGTNVSDIVRAATALLERGLGPCALVGHSLGGAAAVLAAGRIHAVDAVVAVASPSRVDHVLAHVDPAARQRLEAGEDADVRLGGRPFRLGAAFVADLRDHDVRAAARRLGRPLLVVEAGADTVVGPEETRALAEAGGGDLVTVDGADHLFGGLDASRRLGEVVVDWLDRHGPRPPG